MKITIEVLNEINKYYNPLGEHNTFLIDEFLMWARQKGSFYWIWDNAVELAGGVENPKEVIKNFPFSGPNTNEYRDLLIEEWLVFLNQPKYMLNLTEEYECLKNRKWNRNWNKWNVMK